MKTISLAFVVACLVLVAPPIGAMAQEVGQPAPPSAPNALPSLASCVVQERRLDVLMVFDTSGSLRRNDETDRRKVAAEVANHALLQLAGSSGASPSASPVRVDVAVARFDGTFSTRDWHDVATQNSAVVEDIAAVATKDAATGQVTDYVTALAGAQQVLAQRAGATTRPACQAMIWFTDGGYEPRGVPANDQEWAQVTDSLCGPGKVVDQLRSARVTVVSVAMMKGIPEQGVELLKKVTSDPEDPPAQPCGSGPATPGKYLPVSEAAELVDQFLRLTEVVPPTPLCRADQKCSFVLDPLLRSFYVLIHTAADTDTLWLWPPRAGEPQRLTGTSGSATVSGAALRWARIDARTLTLTGTLPADAAATWQGTWRVTLADGAGQPVGGQLYMFGNLAEQIVGKPAFRRGEPWKFQVQTTTATDSQPVTKLAPLRPTVRVTITDGTDTRTATVTPDPARPGRSNVNFTAPAGWYSAAVTVTVFLTVRTADGIDISPPPLTREVPVVTPLAFGVDHLRMRAKGRDSTRVGLTVTAADQGGCVWWKPGSLRWHPAPTKMAVQGAHISPDTCLRIAPHSEEELELWFTADHGWNGTLTGRLEVSQSVAGGAPIDVDMPITVLLTADPNTEDLVKVAIILGALTISPLLFGLIFTRRVVRRFDRPKSLRVLQMRATVRPGPVLPEIHPVDDEPDWLRLDQLRWPEPVPKRRIRVGSVTFHASSSWWNPFATPRTRATSHGLLLATERAGPEQELDGLPLHLPGTVVLSAAAERTPDGFEVEVVAFFGAGVVDESTAAGVRQSAQLAARRLLPVEESVLAE